MLLRNLVVALSIFVCGLVVVPVVTGHGTQAAEAMSYPASQVPSRHGLLLAASSSCRTNCKSQAITCKGQCSPGPNGASCKADCGHKKRAASFETTLAVLM